MQHTSHHAIGAPCTNMHIYDYWIVSLHVWECTYQHCLPHAWMDNFSALYLEWDTLSLSLQVQSPPLVNNSLYSLLPPPLKLAWPSCWWCLGIWSCVFCDVLRRTTVCMNWNVYVWCVCVCVCVCVCPDLISWAFVHLWICVCDLSVCVNIICVTDRYSIFLYIAHLKNTKCQNVIWQLKKKFTIALGMNEPPLLLNHHTSGGQITITTNHHISGGQITIATNHHTSGGQVTIATNHHCY